ncbi:MAG TPA: hypothetical protein IAA23_06710 [Candidatus Helicobacter avistercoris]|nr:hypothetical protein [Candidatus Helicobacter avistercoris]
MPRFFVSLLLSLTLLLSPSLFAFSSLPPSSSNTAQSLQTLSNLIENPEEGITGAIKQVRKTYKL